MGRRTVKLVISYSHIFIFDKFLGVVGGVGSGLRRVGCRRIGRRGRGRSGGSLFGRSCGGSLFGGLSGFPLLFLLLGYLGVCFSGWAFLKETRVVSEAALARGSLTTYNTGLLTGRGIVGINRRIGDAHDWRGTVGLDLSVDQDLAAVL